MYNRTLVVKLFLESNPKMICYFQVFTYVVDTSALYLVQKKGKLYLFLIIIALSDYPIRKFIQACENMIPFSTGFMSVT